MSAGLFFLQRTFLKQRKKWARNCVVAGVLRRGDVAGVVSL